VLAELTRDRELTLLVKAYSDARETNGYNLSVVRARLVVEWLVKRGVAATRLEPRGCGASRAFWIGVNAEQRAANRRADLVRRSPLAGCEPPLSFDFR
jgi:outer membrane protein OmpA-like peptidoglycan-associated protein